MLASGRFKGVNFEWTQLVGESKKVPISLGQWTSTTNFSVAPIDEYEVFFDMRFLDHLRPSMVAHENTILITQEGKPCIVNVCQEMELSPHQLKKGLRKVEPMFVAILSEEDMPMCELRSWC